MESFLPPELAARGNHLESILLSFLPTIYSSLKRHVCTSPEHCNTQSFIVLNFLSNCRMASSRMICCGFLVSVLCFMLLNPISAGTGVGPFRRESPLTMEMRKMLRGRLLNGEYHQLVAAGKGGNGGGVLNEELRMVPSGPDPLHHHGASPKKPQTP